MVFVFRSKYGHKALNYRCPYYYYVGETHVHLIVGNANSTRECGHWIGLEIVLFGQKVQITRIVISIFRILMRGRSYEK